MKRNNTWRWLFVIFIVLWSVYELTPIKDRPLIEQFEKMAVNKDDRFAEIVSAARAGVATGTGSAYSHLLDAAGDTILTNYFPNYQPEPDSNQNAYVLNRIQRKAAGKVRLGIDLKGGTSFRLAMDLDAIKAQQVGTNAPAGTNALVIDPVAAAYEREVALEQAVEVLRRRVDRLGVAEPLIQPVGENQIIVQLPGLSQAEMDSARSQIQRAAFLEFRLVHPNSEQLIAEDLIEPGYERMTEVNVIKGVRVFNDLLVSKRRASGTIDGKRVELTGKHLKQARVNRDPLTGQPEILFELNSEGADLFGQITSENVGERMAIILDGKLASAPNIREAILGGSGSISGGYTDKEAIELANVLENPLQAPLKVLSERRIDPTLGQATIDSGIRAAIYGLIFVIVFMGTYYLIGGMVANAAVMLNLLILMGVLCSIKAALTLPGIAGIVLTIGMAVDANVLIFERIREELRAGKSIRGSVSAGYDKAFSTIFDANITTLIASIILIMLGTGPIKGFGVTLTIGIMVSMFTALVFTRLIFDWLIDAGILRSLKMISLVRGTSFRFLRFAKPAFVLSWLLIIGGVGYGLFVRGSDVLNHEFKGGVEVLFSFNEEGRVDQDQISTAVRQAVGSEPTVQYQRELASGAETLAVKTALINDKSLDESALIDRTAQLVVESLKSNFAGASFEVIDTDKNGPSIGAEIQRSALVSVVLALFGILFYVAVRYEFSFAVGAVVATIHDVLMTLGIYFLSGHQMSAPMVAAVMTIIGFSINDTIVIFDRIREDLMLNVRGSFEDLMNTALNQTLSRTIITSGTTFLATLALYLFGGGGLNDFSFTFLAGIITGTYSSIYIACAIVLWWNKGQRPVIAAAGQAGVVLEEQPAGA
ncbi:MAG TPA: protein translocase subunit SecDF [Verrucomicrobiales bacterium]|nr:protein translocase subunit SecDF [Verrucomicrobiales bacterium]